MCWEVFGWEKWEVYAGNSLGLPVCRVPIGRGRSQAFEAKDLESGVILDLTSSKRGLNFSDHSCLLWFQQQSLGSGHEAGLSPVTSQCNPVPTLVLGGRLVTHMCFFSWTVRIR